MTELNGRGKLFAALAKAQGEIRGAIKDKTNPHLRTKYADLAAVWEACRGPLSANELAVVQLPQEAPAGWVRLITTLGHSSGDEISSVIAMPVMKPDAHGYGSALTYLRRYALSAMVGVAPDDDDGAAAVTQESPPRQPVRQTPPARMDEYAPKVEAPPDEQEQRQTLMLELSMSFSDRMREAKDMATLEKIGGEIKKIGMPDDFSKPLKEMYGKRKKELSA